MRIVEVSLTRQIALVLAITACGLTTTDVRSQAPDWQATGTEAIRTIQEYVRINTSNPPGDVLKAADFLTAILQREGIPVKRYDSGPGRSIVVARLKGTGTAKPLLLLHHMDVVPTDASRWKHDPFAADIEDGKIWGRGAIDMKGLGVVQLMAFLSLKRQNVPLARDVILMAVPDEETGGTLGAEWMRKEHYERVWIPSTCSMRGASAAETSSRRDKLVFGISVAEKKILWLKLAAEGDCRSRIAAARSEPERSARPRARSRCSASRFLASSFASPRHDEVTRRNVCHEQVQQRDPALDDFVDDASVRRWRSAESQRHSVGGGGHHRLPRSPGNYEGTVADGNTTDASAIPKSRSTSSMRDRIPW